MSIKLSFRVNQISNTESFNGKIQLEHLYNSLDRVQQQVLVNVPDVMNPNPIRSGFSDVRNTNQQDIRMVIAELDYTVIARDFICLLYSRIRFLVLGPTPVFIVQLRYLVGGLDGTGTVAQNMTATLRKSRTPEILGISCTEIYSVEYKNFCK